MNMSEIDFVVIGTSIIIVLLYINSEKHQIYIKNSSKSCDCCI